MSLCMSKHGIFRSQEFVKVQRQSTLLYKDQYQCRQLVIFAKQGEIKMSSYAECPVYAESS